MLIIHSALCNHVIDIVLFEMNKYLKCSKRPFLEEEGGGEEPLLAISFLLDSIEERRGALV